MPEIDIFILLGKGLYRNNELDWVGEARCEEALKIMANNPTKKLIITGGKNISDVSESSVMAEYIITKNPQLKEKIMLEELGLSTIHQLVLIKKNILMPQGQDGERFVNIGLITDETHLSRAILTAEYILGDDYKITGFGAPLKISGYYRKSIETYENKMYELTKSNPVLLYCQKGDHEAWLKFDEYKREAKKKPRRQDQKADVNDEYAEILKKELDI
jgi:vancomycin permeability regulator SanA